MTDLNNRFSAFCVKIGLLSLFLVGCSTPDSNVTSTSPQVQYSKNVTLNEERDRGFDPCLVNANLPACEKISGE
ncbi:MAG: hypothetical protein COA99_03840 [Moraxellaceae bacterium]|nr:MAG: hypothetical protein COA99_03840 [Moraxellaceae bacterium]